MSQHTCFAIAFPIPSVAPVTTESRENRKFWVLLYLIHINFRAIWLHDIWNICTDSISHTLKFEYLRHFRSPRGNSFLWNFGPLPAATPTESNRVQPDVTKFDQVHPYPTKTKSDQDRPNPAKSDQIWPKLPKNLTKSNQIRPSPAESDGQICLF